MKKSISFGIVTSIIILGIITGIIIHIVNDDKVEQETAKTIKEINKNIENQIIVQTVTLDEKTSPNAYLTFEIYYNKCGHSKISKKRIDSEYVNKTEAEIEQLFPEWKVKEFSQNQVAFYKESNSICDEHYVIKEKNGYVVIYSLDENGNETIKEKTDIATQYLPNEDVNLLRQGIKAYSNIELEQIISDYE